MRTIFILTSVVSLLVGCSRSLTPAPGTVAEPPSKSGCFGGPIEVVQEQAHVALIDLDDRNGNPMFISEGRLMWSTREGMGGPQLFDLTHRRWGGSKLGRNAFFKTADSREVYSISVQVPNTNDMEMSLVAEDPLTGQRRVVVGSQDRGGVGVWSQVALDGDFVYFLRAALNSDPDPGDGLYRARRDGTGAIERVGDEPKGAYTPFLIHDGYVYWNRDPDFRDPTKKGPAMWRRRLAVDSPVERLAPTANHHLSFTISDGRLFYLDGRTIASVPLDGSEPPRIHVNDTGARPRNVVVEHGCLYWGSERGILRTVGGSGKTEVIVDEANYDGSPIATDGQALYWFDLRNDRILRAGRGDRVLAPRAALVARPIDASKLPPDGATPSSVVWVGDGWGCAKVFGWNQPHWQCWHTDKAKGGTIRAQGVPWLSAEAAPMITGDRFCFSDGKTARCWPASTLDSSAPAGFTEPPRTHRRFGQGDQPFLVGGSFACTMGDIGAERMLECTGDDHFGQLATKEQPPMLEPWTGVLGGWHGCVGAPSRNELACWGRGDAGQLGRAPESLCTVAGQPVACSPEVRPVSFPVEGIGTLHGGDLFTCMKQGYAGPVLCWGGSRDGWFGESPCPPALRQAWPVGGGFVPAPQATCTASPVEVPKLAGQHAVSIGSRGACAKAKVGKSVCLGAIATPEQTVDRIVVSPGSRASACGVADTRVLCWGEDYSPPGKPGQTVAISFEASTPGAAVVDFPAPAGTAWGASHQINQGCQTPAEALPPCAPGLTAEPWSALLTSGGPRKGAKISVRGRLMVGLPANHAEVSDYCNSHRCVRDEHRHPELRHVVVQDGGEPLHLGPAFSRFDCFGDQSRLCCGLQAFGQAVVATGELMDTPDEWGWRLKVDQLCTAAAADTLEVTGK